MSNSTTVNNSFAPVLARPISHLAAATFLATSIYVAHEGLEAALPSSLASAFTALFVALAVLQWLALGRKEACESERDTSRADAVISQAWMFGIIETVLYAAGGLALAAHDGLDVYNWLGISIAVVGAAIFAFANFRVKWVSCDAVPVRKSSHGGTLKPMPLFSDIPVLEAHNDDNLISFDLEKAIREKTARMEAAEASALASAPPVRTAPVRLRLAEKRIRQRARRAA